ELTPPAALCRIATVKLRRVRLRRAALGQIALSPRLSYRLFQYRFLRERRLASQPLLRHWDTEGKQVPVRLRKVHGTTLSSSQSDLESWSEPNQGRLYRQSHS